MIDVYEEDNIIYGMKNISLFLSKKFSETLYFADEDNQLRHKYSLETI